MCSKSSRMKKQKPKSARNPPRKTTPLHNPSRKSRTKTRKHKFLSLKTELSKTESPNSSTETTTTTVEETQNQLNLFPLYPENLFEEKEAHDENVDYFFDSEGGATLNGFVWGEGEGGVGLASDQEDSLTYAYQGQDSEEGGGGGGGTESFFMRNALRQRERDESEEKWVCYEEVVEKKEEETSSCSVQQEYQSLMQGLCLKLDYQKIMNAWSDKGPLYIAGDCPQIVPDVLDEPPAQDSSNSNVSGEGKVPVWKSLDDGTETVDGGEGGYPTMMKMGEREARVLRYKEKRQSRLFSKRIRYEVRKLNAEKRPRMKGRFVKRS